MAGRQQQMMLTKASRQLQYAAGTLSSVEGAGVGWLVVGLGYFVSGMGGGEDRQGVAKLTCRICRPREMDQGLKTHNTDDRDTVCLLYISSAGDLHEVQEEGNFAFLTRTQQKT